MKSKFFEYRILSLVCLTFLFSGSYALADPQTGVDPDVIALDICTNGAESSYLMDSEEMDNYKLTEIWVAACCSNAGRREGNPGWCEYGNKLDVTVINVGNIAAGFGLGGNAEYCRQEDEKYYVTQCAVPPPFRGANIPRENYAPVKRK